MKDPKNITLIIVPYLTICGALYHISYWDTFNINGLAFITLSDIIKSSVYPILSTIFFLYIGLFIATIGPVEKLFPPGAGRNTPIGKKLNSEIGLFIVVILWICLLVIIVKLGETADRWLVFGGLTAIPLSILLDRVGLLSSSFSTDKTRRLFLQILVYLPTFSFAIGKYKSDLIYKNIGFKYILSQAISSKTECSTLDTLKFLGSTEKHFIFIDLKNSKTLFLKSDHVDTLIFEDKK